MSHIFISYSRRNLELAGRIVEALAGNNLDTWIDWKSIPKGEDWEQEIYRGIEEADAFLFLISPDSVASEMCNKEIAHAVRNGKRILPIFIADVDNRAVYGITEGFLTPDAKEKINQRNFIFCRESRDDFDGAIEEIRTTIHTDYEWLRYHTELQVKALRWEHFKDNSRLLRGKELRDAEQYIANTGNLADPQPTTLQRQYLLESRQNIDRIIRVISGSSLGVAVIMIVLALVAWGQRNTAVAERNVRATAQANEQIARETAEVNEKKAKEQATIALARQLASQAELLNAADKKLETSTLLATLSLQIYPNNEAGLFLQRHLDLLARPVYHFPLATEISQFQWSLDGNYLFVATRDRYVQIVDWHTGQKLHEVHVDFDIEKMIQTRNAQRIILQGSSILSAWDFTTTAPLVKFEQTYWNPKEMVVSSDLDWVAAIDPDNHNDLLVYNFNSQIPVRLSYTSPIVALAVTPDDSQLAIALQDSSIRMLEHKSNAVRWETKLDEPVRKIVFSPDGSSIALLLNADKILALESNSGNILYQLSDRGETYSETISYSPDGKKLIIVNPDLLINNAFGKESGAIEHRVTIIDTTIWKRVAQVNAPTDGDIVYHSSGRLAAMFGTEWVYIVDLGQGKVLDKIQTNFDIENIVWDPANAPRWISTIPRQTNCTFEICVPAIRVWDLDTLAESKRIEGGYSLAYAYDAQGQVAGWDTQGGNVYIWNLVPEQEFGLTDDSFISSAPGGDVHFSPDGKWLAVKAGDVNVYKTTASPTSNHTVTKLAFVIRESAAFISFDPSSRFISTLDSDGVVKLWDLSSGDLVSEIQGNTAYLQFSMDGHLLALMEKEGGIRLYNTQTMEKESVIDTRDDSNASLSSITFNREGTTITSSTEGENSSNVTQWDIATGKKITEKQYAGKVFGLEYNSTGEILSLSSLRSEETDCILVGSFGNTITLGIHTDCGAFSLDGRYLLQTKENSVYIWDTQINSYTKQLNHIGAVRQAMFSGDGKYILTTSFDGKTRVWDFDRGVAIAEAWQPDVLAYSADINPVDGEIAMIGAYNHVLRLVYWQRDVLVSYACERVTRNLARYEWTQYTGDAIPYQGICSNLPIDP